MTQEATIAFIQWLEKQLAENHLTDHQLAKRAGISHPVISKARNGILPKWEASVAIARALDIDPIIVFREAGLIQTPSDLDKDFEKLKSVYTRVPEQYRMLAIKLIRTLTEEN